MNTNTTEIQKEEIAITTPPRYRDENYVPDIHCGKSFPTWMFKEKEAEVVLAIPDLPNGNKFYKIYKIQENWHQVTSDLRFFDLKTSSRSKYNGVHKVGKCLGSWICPNSSCTFQAT